MSDPVREAGARRERDRRLVPRIHLRLVVVAVLLASGAALALGRGLPALAGAEPHLATSLAWALALLHAAAGVGLLVPPARRVAAAGAGALLLGWMAFMGATSRTLPAVVTGGLLALALYTAAPEDEGPWPTRERGWAGELLPAFQVLALGFLALWLLGPTLAFLLPPAGALLHRRALRGLGGPPAPGRLLLLWGLLFWVGAGAAWGVAGIAPVTSLLGAAPGWPGWSRSQPLLLPVHAAFMVAGLLAFRAGPGLRAALALAAAAFLGALALGGPAAPGRAGAVLPVVLLATAGLTLARRR